MASQSNIAIIKEKLLDLMESKKMADIAVVIGPEKIPFTTHKFLLSMFSEVFYAMFYGKMAERKDEIALPEDNAEAFQIFLSWIYTDTMNIESVEKAISCLQFADKYLITYMKQICSAYLKKNISSESVFMIHETACTFQQSDLKSACWKYIINNASKIIQQDNIKYVSLEMMSSIVREDELILKSEVDMYDAVVKWGKYQYSDHSPENLREKLNCLLLQIRFLKMTPAQFAGSPCEDGILTKDEQLGILKEISGIKTYANDKTKQWRKPRKSPEDITRLPGHSDESLNLKKWLCPGPTFKCPVERFKSAGDWCTGQKYESEDNWRPVERFESAGDWCTGQKYESEDNWCPVERFESAGDWCTGQKYESEDNWRPVERFESAGDWYTEQKYESEDDWPLVRIESAGEIHTYWGKPLRRN